MKTRESVWTCGTVLLAAHLLAGCTSPMPANLGNYYSTFDHEGVVPSERVLRHGPYRLEVYPMSARLPGHSIFYAPKRNDDAWTMASSYAHAYREELQRASEEHFSRPKPPDLPDLMMGTAWLWMSKTNSPGWESNTGDFAFLSTHTNETMRAMGNLYRCWVFGGKNANNRLSGHDFPAMRRRTAEKYPLLFPGSGKGKRLELAAIQVELAPGENPDIPCFHTVWAFYLRGRDAPGPRFSFMTFSMNNYMPSPCGDQSPLLWDAAAGKAALKTPRGNVPLHVPEKPFVMDETFVAYYRELIENRFAAAVVHLLNTMTDEELDALENGEWGPDEYRFDKSEYDNDGVNSFNASVEENKIRFRYRR